MQDLSSSLDKNDCTNIKQSELWLFRLLYHKTGKQAFRCEVILWQISFRVFIEPTTNQDWFTCLFLLKQTKKKLLSMMKSKNYLWIRCWTPPSSGRIRKHSGRKKQIWKSRLTKVKGKWSNWLAFKKCLFPHFFDTQMHLWDQRVPKIPHRNPLKKGSLSENAMKMHENAHFQPCHA